ncbi:MAG: hypothetical protein LZF86_20002 [Nitrospira sp.]|nr:MAG: hypothetical protein LZF86_20002 [Nitrospira sp.]
MRFGELRLAHRNLLARVTYSARKFSLLSVAVYGELTFPPPDFATIPSSLNKYRCLCVTNRPVNDHFAVARLEGK